ncbi:MAG: hypothetical protein WCV00_15975 [Verrucomicrobiia bacterium]|jgi:hypothetical protein
MTRRALLANLAALPLTLPTTLHAAGAAGNNERPWCDTFSPNKADFSDIGKNPYFLLWPGHRLFLRDGKATLVISVLNETKVVDGVKTRVVEEREMKDGKLAEVSRNYFAISKTTGDVYYFGEDVDTYENGKVTGHEGSWLAGVNGATSGLMMPGMPAVGDRYYQEVAPAVAMDRAEVVSLSETVATPAKSFERCLRTRESSGLKNAGGDKLYAPDVGLVKDGNLILTGVDCPLCKGTNVAP